MEGLLSTGPTPSSFFRTLKKQSSLSLTSWHFSGPGFWILTKGIKRHPVRGQPCQNSIEVLGMEQPSGDMQSELDCCVVGNISANSWRLHAPALLLLVLPQKSNMMPDLSASVSGITKTYLKQPCLPAMLHQLNSQQLSWTVKSCQLYGTKFDGGQNSCLLE